MSWWINEQKDEGRRPQHIQPEPNDDWTEVRRQVYAAYQERCDRSGLLDFAELLLRAHELLRDTPALLAHYRARFREILVDEFQDTNAIQYAFVRVLAGSRAMCSWSATTTRPSMAGAAPRSKSVQRFLKDFPVRRPCGWSRTTVPARIFWALPMR